MYISKTTQSLFYLFPREVGNPKRWIVKDESAFENFLVMNNGNNDCFVSVYGLPDPKTDIINIDKIFIDLDGIPQALEDSQTIFKYCMANKIKVIPVVSGKKGIHLYIKTTPTTLKTQLGKNYLYEKTMGFLSQVFDDNIPETIDLHCVGDIRRITRIPDTKRINGINSYCTYLPFYFVDWNWNDLVKWTKETHTIDYDRLSNIVDLKLLDLSTVPNKKLPAKLRFSHQFLDKVESVIWDDTFKKLLRPCLYRHITSVNPCHKARLAVSIDLLKFFKPVDIANRYEKLNWRDFDYDTTLYQIKSCTKYDIWSCSKLEEKKLPRECCVD